MKMTLKRENNKLSSMILKPVSSPISFRISLEVQKKPIAHEKALKRENDKFSTMTLKTYIGSNKPFE